MKLLTNPKSEIRNPESKIRYYYNCIRINIPYSNYLLNSASLNGRLR